MNIPDLTANLRAERTALEGIDAATKRQGVCGYPIGAPIHPTEAMAFNKACEAGYIRMVNIRTVIASPAPNQPPVPMAIATYLLTREGHARLNELRERDRLAKAVQ